MPEVFPAFLLTAAAATAHAAPLQYATLKAGDRAHRFEATTVYLDAADRPMGARFMHRPTGFQLDLLQIESVPQAFTWVKTFATSDQGEPHTQEHLLLLRGKRGRTLATKQSMSLAVHSAYTETWRTSYFFNTSAGLDTFFDLYAEQQRAMLHPDYSDAEIRLEVRNFGVTKADDGRLRLEEKGTVYNEMSSSMRNPGWQAWRARNHAVYGTKHALSYNQGGEPAGIRTMTPEDIRRFHAATHHLANMGTIAAFPRAVPLADLLARFDRVLMRDAPMRGAKPRAADSLDRLPPPAGDPEGALRIYEYPSSNAGQPSPVTVVWPARRTLDGTEQLLAELFFANLAGGPGTNVYGLLIDSRSRALDSGVRSLSATVGEWGGHPVAIDIGEARPSAMTDDGLRALRAVVVTEIERIAALADGSAELAAFNQRIASRLAERERQALKFLGTPPGFGARNGSSAWANLLHRLERSPGPRKSLVLKPEIEAARAQLGQPHNVWRELLARWRISGVTPYVVGARPNPALISREQSERDARLAAETARLKRQYGTDDAQRALALFAADAGAELARVDRETQVPPAPFVKAPPMTLDDALQFEAVRVARGVPLVASRFDSMTGATTGLALRLEGVPREELRYLSLLPGLLTEVGVIGDDGRPMPSEEMTERLRREILALDGRFATHARSGRVELVLRGSGVGLDESRRAIDWMARVLHAPDWRVQNLPRIRDHVDQQLAALRRTMQRAEETWVNDPADAWRMQTNPVWLATASFLTRTHNALRLRWQLLDPAPGDEAALGAFLTRLAEAGRGLDRSQLKGLLILGQTPGWQELSESQRALATEALRDLDLGLAEMADASLGADFAALTTALRDDLLLPASEVLARLDALRQRLLRAGGARLFLASSHEMRAALAPAIDALAQRLDATPFAAQPAGSDALIGARLAQRGADPAPVHVALHAPDKFGSVILTSAPLAHFGDAGDEEKLLDFLASRLYAGYGSHGLFSKTIGVGLAYSNGLRGAPSSGRVGYYAERTLALPRTVRFVIDLVRQGRPEPALADYVMAQAFGESRASMTYEARAEGIAADLAEGQPPEQVRRFRQAVLALRRDPQLIGKLFERKDRVHARVLPGYASQGLDTADGHSFVIGPTPQLAAWERYLKEAVGPTAKLQRLYPRDYWLP